MGKVIAYKGSLNPYNIPLTIGELVLPGADVDLKYQPRDIISQVFNHLHSYEEANRDPDEIKQLEDRIQRLEDELKIVYNLADNMLGAASNHWSSTHGGITEAVEAYRDWLNAGQTVREDYE